METPCLSDLTAAGDATCWIALMRDSSSFIEKGWTVQPVTSDYFRHA